MIYIDIYSPKYNMRMWLVNPKLMCDKHLLGEHVELHMLVGSLNKSKNIEGFIKKGLIETSKINSRHKEIVKEMLSRGFKHQSNLPKFKHKNQGSMNKVKSLEELMKRCKRCKEKINKNKKKYYCPPFSCKILN